MSSCWTAVFYSLVSTVFWMLCSFSWYIYFSFFFLLATTLPIQPLYSSLPYPFYFFSILSISSLSPPLSSSNSSSPLVSLFPYPPPSPLLSLLSHLPSPPLSPPPLSSPFLSQELDSRPSSRTILWTNSASVRSLILPTVRPHGTKTLDSWCLFVFYIYTYTYCTLHCLLFAYIERGREDWREERERKGKGEEGERG